MTTMTMISEDSEAARRGRPLDETDRLIRAVLLETGRKCRLCMVIVQPALTGDLDDGMTMHRKVVHGIGA
jgi:hypothetical protein